MQASERANFLGETLFHFLGHGSNDQLFDIFDSIVRRGLLLTVGNKQGKLDRFRISLSNGTVEAIEIMQRARACFTDIPERHLAAHGEEYGRFGIGFSRKTILSWGGNPVIYLPNHPSADTFESTMGSMLYMQHRIPLLLAALKACMAPGNATLTINQKTLAGEERDQYIHQAELSLRYMWSFVKEMSGDENDYRYLYEREWRVVEGGVLNGNSAARLLTGEEAHELASKCPRWNNPIQMEPENLQRFPHQHAHQFFHFFNGVSGKTISQEMQTLLVPDEDLRARVQEYLERHPERFSEPKPNVKVFSGI